MTGGASDANPEARGSETIFAPGPCALCGRDPAVGFASIGDEWFCHGDLDPELTCYMRSQWKLSSGSSPGVADAKEET